MTLETERLWLRELTLEDLNDWHAILSDAETMKHYPAPFSLEKVKQWIAWNLDNYATYGFGLWAVMTKETNRFIGDCGITMQNIHGQMLPEIGYHIRKDQQRKGYASEAARECMRYAFDTLELPAIYSYMKYTNAASYGVAVKNGMKLVEEYEDPVNTITKVYAITREEWKRMSVSCQTK